jgi:hypothetical protein
VYLRFQDFYLYCNSIIWWQMKEGMSNSTLPFPVKLIVSPFGTSRTDFTGRGVPE